MTVVYTEGELRKWWVAECPKCKWIGLSRDCAGGQPIADTGDYGEVLCPKCYENDDFVAVDEAVTV